MPPAAARARGRSLDAARGLLEGARRGRAALGRFAGALLPSGQRRRTEVQQLHLALDDVGPAAVHVGVDEERPSFELQPSHLDEDRPSFELRPSQVDEERPSFLGSLSDADDDRPFFQCRLSHMDESRRTFGDGGSATQERPSFDFQPSDLDEDHPSFLGSLSDVDNDVGKSRHTFGDGGSAPQGTDDSWAFARFWERIEDAEEQEIRQCVHRRREASRLPERTRGTM